MPSQEPAIQTLQEKGFRTSFRGFDKNDVLAYMNALANETQQRESEYEEQIDRLKAQNEKLRSEQSAARACVDKLQSDLAGATQRAETAEKAAAAAAARAQTAEERASTLQNRYRESQQSILEWQFKCRDLQKQVDEMEAMIPKGGAAAPKPAKAPEPDKVPAPPPEPAPAPQPAPTVTEEARIEARRILVEARLKAESAELRLQQQADEQKARMADHARDLAAAIELLRARVNQADDKISLASFDLEDATTALYQALAATEEDFAAFDVQLRRFGDPLPQTPSSPAPAPGEPVRSKAVAQPVAKRSRPASQPPAAEPVHRLRRPARDRRSVSQELADALNRLDQK